ncbi:MAG TPA: Uma2 family endonuclease [Pirellulales bacterium]|nr:Uma2 family endonuclease [Pirellulales bacterium]
MATAPTTADSAKTLAEVLAPLAGVPLDRIRANPAPGSATVQDVINIQEREGVLCELVAGVLLEKPVGYSESLLATAIIELLNAFVRSRNLGHVTGEAGTIQLLPNLVRIPDVAYTSWDRLPGGQRPKERVPLLAPNIVIEIFSEGNTPLAMSEKRRLYFEAGVDLVWEIDPERRSATAYRSPTDFEQFGANDRLDGGTILPGFALPLAEVFAELDRRRA